jgi:hypothetical protein
MDPEPEVYESPDPPARAHLNVDPDAGVAVAASISAEDVVEYTVDARESFEVFMGRRYDLAERPLLDAAAAAGGRGGGGGLYAQGLLLPSSPAFDKLAKHLAGTLDAGLSPSGRRGAAGPVPRRLETPLVRYTRLVDEVKALQGDLRAVAGAQAQAPAPALATATARSQQQQRAPGTTPVDDSAGIMGVLTTGTSALVAELSGMEGAARSAPAAAGGAGGAVATPEPSAAATYDALREDIASLKATQASLLAAAEAMRASLVAMEQRLARATRG